ncbi:MAG: methyltransferase domain-containing protein [Acidimicrobiia bacterium]|nr:methyltransferase domain-containing protein [Acidimicrobiia bacterium]
MVPERHRPGCPRPQESATTTTDHQDTSLTVDPEALRAEVREKYAEVATNPGATFHFHTGRPLAERLGYAAEILDGLPDEAMASFAGVDNPFAAAPVPEGSRVLDLGSGGGFDCFVAARIVGDRGHVVGVDMTPAMLERARRLAESLGLTNVEFREGILEELPVEDGSADVVISNGVLNLVADKPRVFAEAFRALRPGGVLQVADIAVGREVPHEARCDIGLWTDCIAGGQSVSRWCELIDAAGFTGVSVGMPTDTFGEAEGEPRARDYEVFAHTFRARKP